DGMDGQQDVLHRVLDILGRAVVFGRDRAHVGGDLGEELMVGALVPGLRARHQRAPAVLRPAARAGPLHGRTIPCGRVGSTTPAGYGDPRPPSPPNERHRVSYEPPQPRLNNPILRAGRAIRWPLMMPFWAGQVLTGAKSFTNNPILGSRRLNALGLHVW